MKINCKLPFVCMVSFSIILLTLPAVAASGAIQVKCVDASGSPVAGARVVVVSLKSPDKMKDKKSDAQGVAELTKLDPGYYRIFGRKDGMVPALFEFVNVKDAEESVSLKFVAGADKKFYFEDQAEEKRGVDLYRQAIDLFKQQKFAEMEKMLVEAVDIVPSNPDMLLYLGVARLQQGKFDQGVEDLNHSAQVAEVFASVAPARASQYKQTQDNALGLVKKVPALKADVALRQQKFDVAAAAYADAIKADPNNSELYANLAISLANQKKFDEALPNVDKALQLKPQEKAYSDLKAQILTRKQNAELDKAQSVMDAGNGLFRDGDYAGAIKKFEQARDMVSPERQSPLWRQIARAQANLNQNDAAVASFRKSIELAPADKAAEFRTSFAQYYIDLKKYDDAVEVLSDPKAAAAQSQTVEQVLLDLAKTSKNKDPKLFEAALEKVIRTNPANADAYFDLGQMYYADGKEKDSRTKELLTKYTEIGKDADKIEGAKNMLILINRRNK